MTPQARRAPVSGSDAPYVSGRSWTMMAEPTASKTEWPGPSSSVTPTVKKSARATPSDAA